MIPTPPGPGRLLPAACALALAAPMLWAYQLPPAPALLTQCLAVVLWGLVAALAAPRRVSAAAWPALAALLILLLAALASWRWGLLPPSLALPPMGVLAGAALLVIAGADLAARGRLLAVGTGLAWGLLAAGLLSSLVAVIQVVAPGWTHEAWLASSPLAGRAIGNLRQPNQLCTLLLWASAAALALHELQRLPRAALWAGGALLAGAIALTGSRMGIAGLVLLAVLGLANRQVSPHGRRWLLAMPVLYALVAVVLLLTADGAQQTVGARLLADAGAGPAVHSPNSRSAIWFNTLALIALQPWAGVGFGEFNLAWTLTPFAQRPDTAFVHAHNLVLHLAAELGVPLAALVLSALGLALWRALDGARRDHGPTRPLRWLLLFLVGWMLLHSMVEHPLWFSYLLLPTAFAWGLALGRDDARAAAAPWRLYHPLAGLVLAGGGALAAADYWIVADMYRPESDAGPAAQRIARGQMSPLFAHHADYAAAVIEVPPYSRTMGLKRAMHLAVDPRLQMAWARQLASAGRLDEARWLAWRLREFHSRDPGVHAFFAECDGAGATTFQCRPPVAAFGWRALAATPMAAAAPAAPPASAPTPTPASLPPGSSATQAGTPAAAGRLPGRP